jgi:hypothetical protein
MYTNTSLRDGKEIVINGYGKIRFVIASYLNDEYSYRLNTLKCLIYSIVSQTYQDFEIYIHHDGPINDSSIKSEIEKIDSRITFIVGSERKGSWGFYERRDIALIQPVSDWIVFTNDDNYYVPKFAEVMLNLLHTHKTEMIFCNLILNGIGYNVLDTEIRIGGVDLGCYVLSSNIVKQVPWTDYCSGADGIYAIKAAALTNPIKLKNVLFVHN